MKTEEKLLPEVQPLEVNDVVNTSEFVSDFSFQHRIFQLNLLLNADLENNGFCLEI